MKIQRKYGIEWQIPSDLQHVEQDLLSQVAAAKVPMFDQVEQMLICNSPQDMDSVLACIQQDKRWTVETCELLWVSSGTVISPSDRFEDFAFVSSQGHVYFDLTYVDVFRLLAMKPEAETAPALMQLDEHRIAEISAAASEDEPGWQVIERQLAELADRVARAYHCDIQWLDLAAL